jgi:membrane protease YdiL (CAAX protease family)
VRPAPGEQRFQAGHALAAWLIAFTVAFSGQIAILSAAGYAGTQPEDRPLWLDAVLLVPLWISLLAATIIISRHWGTGRLRDDYGLRFRAFDVLGVPIGILTQAVLVPALYWTLELVLPWDLGDVSEQARTLTDRAGSDAEVVLLVFMVVIGAPIIEELFFRGLLMRSIQARLNDGLALVLSALFFALVHFQVLQIPGLFLFGLIAGTCAQRTGRLGMSILAHSAFNATAVVMLLTT